MSENPLETVARRYFESEKVVTHYLRDGQRVGLWKSESILFQEVFSKQDRILDLGCGTGRIAFGLEGLGFSHVTGADFSRSMVEGAKMIAESLKSAVSFIQADARELPWKAATFDGVIFGFNGFFMIPGHEERLKALREIHRVLKPGGRFIFTGHDRSLSNQRSHWAQADASDSNEECKTGHREYGDVVANTELGEMYIHSTSQEDVEILLTSHQFQGIQTWLRSELGNESTDVRQFADECRFWKAERA